MDVKRSPSSPHCNFNSTVSERAVVKRRRVSSVFSAIFVLLCLMVSFSLKRGFFSSHFA